MELKSKDKKEFDNLRKINSVGKKKILFIGLTIPLIFIKE